MSRYLFFAYSIHEPKGGINDLKGMFDSIEDLHTYLHEHSSELRGDYDFFQLFDMKLHKPQPIDWLDFSRRKHHPSDEEEEEEQ
ncbi:MAG: hypothetical protein KIG60_08350 [Caryophanon sp.]|nr:hypothetical protein [Caryophanon sp.]